MRGNPPVPLRQGDGLDRRRHRGEVGGEGDVQPRATIGDEGLVVAVELRGRGGVLGEEIRRCTEAWLAGIVEGGAMYRHLLTTVLF